VQATEVGTPQGSILSPLLANVYLHDVVDIWFQRRGRRQCRGKAYVFRFADDVLAGVQYRTAAESVLESLGERLGEFHLELAEEKTRHLECGRYARANAYRRGEKPQEFTVLGMTVFGGKTRHGAFKVKRKTSRKKLRQSLARFTEWLRRYRNVLPTGALLRQAKARVQGHLNYSAITDNSESCQLSLHLTRRVLFKWLNRRSQRKSYTWDGFLQALRHVGWPQARVRVNLNPFARLNG
jgi:RNA-directed DNA polymerase